MSGFTDQQKKELVEIISEVILPLRNDINILKQKVDFLEKEMVSLKEEMVSLKEEMGSLKEEVGSLNVKFDFLDKKVDSFYNEFSEFKENSYTFFDNSTQQLEDLKIEYDFIKHQMREYDILLQNPEKTEDERYAFWKKLSEKVTIFIDKVADLERVVAKK